MAAYCGTYYSSPSDNDILGTSGLVRYIQDHLYGDHILSAGSGIHMCKYSLRNPLWSDDTGYLLVAIIYGCIFAACHIFCFAKTKEQVTIPEKEKISIKVQIKAVMQNRPYLLALVGQVLFGFTLYGRNADVLYYFTYVEGNASYYTTYSMCIIIPSIIGAACFQPVFRKLNNKGRTASMFALLAALLGKYGYVANQAQNSAVLSIMKHSFTTIPGILWIVTAVVLFFYRLNRKRYNEIVEDLKHGKRG